MNKISILLFFTLGSVCSFSQTVFIKSNNKLADLSSLKSTKVYQYQLSSGKDSIYRITDVDSLYKHGDTLVVRPWLIEETHYLDPNAEISTQKLFKASSKQTIKIPIVEIDKIVGKKRAITKVLNVVSTAAFLGVAASIPMRFSKPDNPDAKNLFLVAAPTLLVSWTLQATIAKKRYHFDRNRTKKRTWIFN